MDKEFLGKLDNLGLQYLGRRLSHLTPRYAIDKLRRHQYEHSHPDAPWLAADAITILSTVLRKSDRGLEYGCGRSTLWFAKRTASLISLENSWEWYQRTCAALRSEKLDNVRLKYIPADPQHENDSYRADYV